MSAASDHFRGLTRRIGLRFALSYIVVGLLWLPFRSLSVALIAFVAQSSLHLADHPRVLSALSGDGGIVSIFGYVSGVNHVLARWNAWNVHVVAVTCLAAAQAIPDRTRSERARDAFSALVLAFLTSVVICVTAVKCAAQSYATAFLGLSIYSDFEVSCLSLINRAFVTFGMLILPLVLLMTGAASIAFPSRRRDRPTGRAWPWAAISGVIAVMAVILASGLTPDSESDYREGLLWIRDHNPSSPRPDFHLGTFSESLGQLDAAAEAYRAALEKAPRYAMAHYGLANVLYRQARLDEAVEEYRRSLSIDPDQVSAYENLGIALYELGRWDEAARSFQVVVAREPRHANAHHNLALSLMKLHRECEALPHLEQCIGSDMRYANDARLRYQASDLRRSCAASAR